METEAHHRNSSQLEKALAILIVPALFYVTGTFIIFKVLKLARVKPLWSDFGFLHTINTGLNLFTGNLSQEVWLAAVILALAAPFAFRKLSFILL